MRHKVRVGVAEPQKLHLQHFTSQRNKIQYPFALHIMPYADDHGLIRRQAVLFPQDGPAGGVGGKKPGIHAVGKRHDGRAQTVTCQFFG